MLAILKEKHIMYKTICNILNNLQHTKRLMF